MFGYPEFIKSLLQIQNPQDLTADFDYVKAFNLGKKDIPHLIRMATDGGFLHYEEFRPVTDFSWLPVHAWRILGQLNDKKSIDGLWTLFLLPQIYTINLHLPGAMLKFEFNGLFESLKNNFNSYEWSDNGFALLCEILEGYAMHSPDNRRRIVAFLSALLDVYSEQSEYLNARVAKSLCRMDALQCFETISQALMGEFIDFNLFSPEEFLIYLRRADKIHSIPAEQKLRELDQNIVEHFELGEIENSQLNHEFLQFKNFSAVSDIQRSTLRYLFEKLGPVRFSELALKVNRLNKISFLPCLSKILFSQLMFIMSIDTGTETTDKLFEGIAAPPSQFGAVHSDEEKRAFRHFNRHMTILLENSEQPDEDFHFLFLICYSQMLDGQTSFIPPRDDLKISDRILGLMRRLIQVSHEDAHMLIDEAMLKPNSLRPSVFSILMSGLSHDICKILNGLNILTSEERNFDLDTHEDEEDDDDFFDKNDTFDIDITDYFKSPPPDFDPHRN